MTHVLSEAPRDSRSGGDEMWQMLRMIWGIRPCTPSVSIQPNCHKWDGCLFFRTDGWVVTFPPYRPLMSSWWNICFIVSPYYVNSCQCAWWQYVIWHVGCISALRMICDFVTWSCFLVLSPVPAIAGVYIKLPIIFIILCKDIILQFRDV